MLYQRLSTHHLLQPALPGPADVVGRYGAIQAQDFPGALWAIAQRLAPHAALSEASLLAAFDQGLLVRTHILRPTWHLVRPDDLRWMLMLSGPRVQLANATRYTQLELAPADRLKAERTLHRVLAGGRAATRPQLAEALRRAGIAPGGQRIVYLLMHAELEGLICSGPRQGALHTYVLVDDRVPPTPPVSPDEALVRLVTNYFISHGPATIKDCAWWSGLTTRDVREGIALAGDALGRQPGDDSRWHAAERSPRRTAQVHLLPNFDEYTVGYRDRTALLHRSTPATSPAQSALLSQPVLVDGRHAGSWKRSLTGGTRRRPGTSGRVRRTAGEQPAVVVKVVLVEPPSPAVTRLLQRAVARYGAFLERTPSLDLG